jgi:hypothetical protein
MKQFFTLFLSLFFLTVVGAQTCLPDSTLADAEFPVQPPPFDPVSFPDGGIKDTACINTPFDYVFSAVVGDTFSLGIANLPLDSIRMPVNNAIIGMPVGLNYACNPPNCVFEQNTLGCINLYGELTDDALIGEYDLKISVQVFLNGSPQPVNFVLPDGNFIMGEYKLVVREESFNNCATVSTDTPFEDYTETKVIPNPSSGNALLEITSRENTSATLQIMNINGQIIEERQVNVLDGVNTIGLDLNDYQNGLYLYHLSNGSGRVSGKFSVVK